MLRKLYLSFLLGNSFLLPNRRQCNIFVETSEPHFSPSPPRPLRWESTLTAICGTAGRKGHLPEVASEEVIKKTALQDVYGVPDPGGQACRAWQGRVCVCVLDEAAVFKSRWPMMSLEKTLKRATRKNFFYGSLWNVTIGWAWGREKKKLKDFLTPCLSLWAAGKGGREEGKRLGGKRGKSKRIKGVES